MHIKQFLYRTEEILNLRNFFGNLNALCNVCLYPLFPYLKYIVDKHKGESDIYTLYNFYWGASVEKFWVTRFIEHNKLNKKKVKLDFFSVFGPKKIITYSKNFRIFYTGEPVASDMYFEYNDYCLSDVDLSIGFREYEGINNYYRLPQRLSYLLLPEKTDLNDIKDALQHIENEKNIKNRKNFCALISRHDDIAQTRFNTYKRLCIFGKIQCPGRFLHNDDSNIPLYNDKINYLKNFIFNICPENHLDKGYVTEKLIDSLKAGCIPIYNGIFGTSEEAIFNKKRIVFIDKDLEKNVSKLISYDSYYEDFINQPIFNKNADEVIYNQINGFKKKLKQIIL